MFRYDFQHPDPDSSIPPSKEDLPPLPEVGGAHMPGAPSNNVPSQETPTSSASLVLRPRWPSPAQVAFGALGKEEPFTPVPSQYRSQDTYLPSRAVHSFPRPGNQQEDVSKALTPESSTPDMMDMALRMESLLQPVTILLARLQGTTLPPYNPRVQTKSAAQVLSDRLLPVGQYVLNLLKREWEDEVSEVDICDYIADTYWPQDLMPMNGLNIMEMYRNAMFLGRVKAEHLAVEQAIQGGGRLQNGVGEVDGLNAGEQMDGVEARDEVKGD